MSEANQVQIGGAHYKSAQGLQHWDLVETYRVGYLEGNASKYLTRWRKKNGVQDLQKAAHYLRKLYECRADLPHDEQVARHPNVPHAVVSKFSAANGLTLQEEQIPGHILCRKSSATIDLARREVERLIAEASDDGAEAGAGYVNQD